MEKLILKITDNTKMHFLLELLKQLDFVEIQKSKKEISKKSKSKHDLFSSAGIWKGRDINVKKLRKEAWKNQK